MTRRRNRNGKQSRRTGSSTRYTSLIKRAGLEYCSYTDPFCPAAKHAKLPSPTNSNTVSYPKRNLYTVTTGASGTAYIVVRASESTLNCFQAAIASGNTFPATSAFDVAMGAFPSLVNEVRIVSSGIRVWNKLAATDAGGFVQLTELEDAFSLLDGATHTFGSLGDGDSTTLDIRRPFEYHFNPTDKGSIETFHPVSTSGTDMGSTWNCVVLCFNGPASTDVAYVEHVINYECTIHFEADGLAVGAPNRSSHKAIEPIFVKERGIKYGNREAIHEEIKKHGENIAKKLLRPVADAAGAAIGGFFGGPAGAVMGAEFIDSII